MTIFIIFTTICLVFLLLFGRPDRLRTAADETKYPAFRSVLKRLRNHRVKADYVHESDGVLFISFDNDVKVRLIAFDNFIQASVYTPFATYSDDFDCDEAGLNSLLLFITPTIQNLKR